MFTKQSPYFSVSNGVTQLPTINSNPITVLIWESLSPAQGIQNSIKEHLSSIAVNCNSDFARAAPLSVPFKWALTSANLAAQCRYEPTLHALFFQAVEAE